MHEIGSDELQEQCERIEELNDILDDVHSTGVEQNVARIEAELTDELYIETRDVFPFELGDWTDTGLLYVSPDGTVQFNVSKEELHE